MSSGSGDKSAEEGARTPALLALSTDYISGKVLDCFFANQIV